MLEAICRMIACISLMISLSLFSLETLKPEQIKNNEIFPTFRTIRNFLKSILSTRKKKLKIKIWFIYPCSTTSPSVSMLKFHLSRTSLVALLIITRTILCNFPVSSHSLQENQISHQHCTNASNITSQNEKTEVRKANSFEKNVTFFFGIFFMY